MNNPYLPYWIISLLMSSLLFGETQDSLPVAMNSTEAEYNGREITLVGEAVVQHELGKISAHRFSIVPSQADKKFKFSKLTMHDNVRLDFPAKGSLICEEAVLDYDKLHGIFLGSTEKPDVVFNTLPSEQASADSAQPQMTLKGEQLQIWFVKASEKVKGHNNLELNQMQMDGRIRFDYNQNYHLTADHAHYHRANFNPENKLTGTLFLSAPYHPPCQITTPQNDQVFAKTITVDIEKRCIVLSDAHGTLSHQSGTSSKKLNFEADSLTWNEIDQTLSLAGKIKITNENYLELRTDGSLLLTYHHVNGKREVKSIHCPQPTELVYLEADAESSHKLICYGNLFIDHEHLQIRMDSPKDQEGNILKDKQVFLEDVRGEMCADQVHIHYKKQETGFELAKIHFSGHVQVFNRFNGHLQETSSVLQYALADELEYFPALQNMQLKAHANNRVLFFDKINSLQMSAPALSIDYNTTTQQEKIQGIGDVRLTFIESEFNELKERFRFSERKRGQ